MRARAGGLARPPGPHRGPDPRGFQLSLWLGGASPGRSFPEADLSRSSEESQRATRAKLLLLISMAPPSSGFYA